MKNNNYVEAFSRVTVDETITDSIVDCFRKDADAASRDAARSKGRVGRKGFSGFGSHVGRKGSSGLGSRVGRKERIGFGSRGGRRPATVFAFVLVAALAFGGVAYAAGAFSGGQFVKSIADPQGATLAPEASFATPMAASEEQDKALYNASTEVGETVTHGNVAMTLDEVTVDEFAIYTKLTIRSVDGKPLYTGDPDVCAASNFLFYDGEVLRPSTSYAPYDWERLDDGSDAAYIEIAQRRDFYESLISFDETVVTFSGLGTFTDSESNTDSYVKPISDEAFEFTLPINPIAARSFTAQINGTTVDVKLTPLSISYSYKGDDDLMLEPVDKSGVAYSHGSGGLGSVDADGYRTGIFSLADENDQSRSVMINVDSIASVKDAQAANSEAYTLTEH